MLLVNRIDFTVFSSFINVKRGELKLEKMGTKIENQLSATKGLFSLAFEAKFVVFQDFTRSVKHFITKQTYQVTLSNISLIHIFKLNTG
ncbi:MAG: hypothetical protein ACK5MD_06565 [Flavobacteriales bacterium]